MAASERSACTTPLPPARRSAKADESAEVPAVERICASQRRSALTPLGVVMMRSSVSRRAARQASEMSYTSYMQW